MGRVVKAVVGIGLAIAGVVTGNPALITLGLSMGLSYGVGALSSGKPQDFTAGSTSSQSPRYELDGFRNMRSNMVPLPLIYTEDGIRVSTVELWNSGQGTEQKRLLVVGAGELAEIGDVELNGEPYDTYPGTSASIYTGTSTQIVDPRYTEDKIGGLRDTAYLAVTLGASDKLSGDPIVTLNIRRGRIVERWNGTDWTSLGKDASGNPAAVIRDYLLLSRDQGGVGLDIDELDHESFGEVYEWANVIVSDGTGGVESRSRISYTIDTFREWSDVLHDLLISFGGFITTDGKVLKLHVEKAEIPVQAFEPGDLDGSVIDGTFEYFTFSKQARPNRVVGIYIDPTEDGNDARVRTPAIDDYEDQLSNPRGVVPLEISYLPISRQSQAIREATKNLNDIKVNWYGCKFQTDIDSVHCEEGDVIKVRHSILGDGESWFLFRVQAIDEESDHTRQLTCKAYNPTVFTDDLDISPVEIDSVKVNNPFAPAADVTNLVISEFGGYFNNDNTYTSRIKFSFDGSVSINATRYKVSIKKGGGNYVFENYLPLSETNFDIAAIVIPGSTYQVRVQVENDQYIFSDGTESNELTIIGKDYPPSQITNYTVTMDGDRLKHSWYSLYDRDLAKYQIFEGSIFSTAILQAEGLFPGGEYIQERFSNGTRTFWIVAVDNSGLVSDPTPYQIDITNAPQNVKLEFDVNIEHSTENTVNTMLEYITVDGYPRMIPTIAINTQVQWDDITDFEGVPWNFPVVSEQASFETKTFDIGGIGTGQISADIGAVSIEPITFLTEINTSNDGINWNGWRIFTVASHTCRYFKFKFTFFSNAVSSGTINIYRITPIFDIDDTVEEKTVTITDANGGLDVIYDTQFSGVPERGKGTLELFDADAGKWLHGKSFNETKAGFRVKAINVETAALDTGNIRYKARSYILTI